MATWRPRSGAFEPAPSLYVLDYGLDLPLTGSEPQLTENDETLGCGTASLCWYQDRHGGGQPPLGILAASASRCHGRGG